MIRRRTPGGIAAPGPSRRRRSTRARTAVRRQLGEQRFGFGEGPGRLLYAPLFGSAWREPLPVSLFNLLVGLLHVRQELAAIGKDAAAFCQAARREARPAGVCHSANSATSFAYTSRRRSNSVRNSEMTGWTASAIEIWSHNGFGFFLTMKTSPCG